MSGPLLRDLLAVLVEGSRQALRLRVEGRSVASGPAPDWIDAAAAFDVLGPRAGSTCLELEAPALADAAPDRFGQQRLFEEVQGGMTALDYFEEAVSDGIAGSADSERFDAGLLATVEGFARVFRHGIIAIDWAGKGQLRIDPAGIDAVSRMSGSTPRPRQVIVAGKLEGIRHGGLKFVLQLAGGKELHGVAASAEVTESVLRALWPKPVVVHGVARFRPSGGVLRLEAGRVELARGDTSLFEHPPQPIDAGPEPSGLRRPQRATTGIHAIMGQWPGAEPDDVLEEQLEDLS